MLNPNLCGVCFYPLDENRDCPVCDADVPALLSRIKRLEQESTQRGARLQIMREWMVDTLWDGHSTWHRLLQERPGVIDWFDFDGVPVREE